MGTANFLNNLPSDHSSWLSRPIDGVALDTKCHHCDRAGSAQPAAQLCGGWRRYSGRTTVFSHGGVFTISSWRPLVCTVYSLCMNFKYPLQHSSLIYYRYYVMIPVALAIFFACKC